MKPSPREFLLKCYSAGLAEVEGRAIVTRRLLATRFARPVYLIAMGKAAESMARGALDALGDHIAGAFIVTRTRTEALPWPVYEGGHPIPDARSLKAGRELVAYAASIPTDAPVLVLLSGGASALVELLPDGISLDAVQRVNEWLLASGLDIAAMNAVRRRLSLIKGGRLAGQLAPRDITALAISDVPGDDVRWIGSGPLTPIGTDERLPPALPAFIQKMLSSCPAPVTNHKPVVVEIIASNRYALQAVHRCAETQGKRAEVNARLVTGDAAEAGQRLARALLESPRGVLHAWGGETTVRLPANPGRGGRAQHLALSAAMALTGQNGIYLLAAGTDGSDGPGEDTGALVDGGTVERGERYAGSAAEALRRADAGRFLEASGDLLQTGPTGTNVMDLMLGWRE